MKLLPVGSSFIAFIYFALGWSYFLFPQEQLEVKCEELKNFLDFASKQKYVEIQLPKYELNCAFQPEDAQVLAFKIFGVLILICSALTMQQIKIGCWVLLLFQIVQTFVFENTLANQLISSEDFVVNIAIIGIIVLYISELSEIQNLNLPEHEVQQQPQENKQVDQNLNQQPIINQQPVGQMPKEQQQQQQVNPNQQQAKQNQQQQQPEEQKQLIAGGQIKEEIKQNQVKQQVEVKDNKQQQEQQKQPSEKKAKKGKKKQNKKK